MIKLKSYRSKLLTAGTLLVGSMAVALIPTNASAALVTGTASFTLDNAAVAGTNAGGWFFENFWGAAENTLGIDGSTPGGTALSPTGSSTVYAPVNTNTTTIAYPSAGAYGRTTQATTMDASDTSVGQIGLSGAFRMRDPSLTTYLGPFDFSVVKEAGNWAIKSYDTGFGTAGLFALTNVSETLNGSGELLLSGDLMWASGFGYAAVIGANTSTIIGSFELAPDVAAVPVPAAAWLFGGALASLFCVGRKKKTMAA